MRTTFLVLPFIIFLIYACGVKSPPVAPKGTELPSLIDHYKHSSNHDSKEKEEED